MADTTDNQQQNNGQQGQKTTPTKIVSAGLPTVGFPSVLGGMPELGENGGIDAKDDKTTTASASSGTNDQQNNDDKNKDAGTGGTGVSDSGDNGNGSKGNEHLDVPALTPEQIEKLFGFKGTVEEFKAHLEKTGGSQQQATKTEPTAEEKERSEKEFENRILQRFTTAGGTIEQYATLKRLANAKPEDLSLAELKRELKESGFNEDEASSIIEEHYFQLSDDDIAKYDDETDREFAKRKRDYGKKKMNSIAENFINTAQKALKDLRESIEAEDASVKDATEKEKNISSTVDEVLSKFERKLSFNMGEQNGQTIPPVEFEVSTADIDEVKDLLKDPSKRKSFFYNEDGTTLNLSNITNVLLRNKALEKAVKHAYTTGVDRQVEEFEKVFPKSAQSVGLGNPMANDKNKGSKKVVSVGKPTIGIPQQRY
jgi:hypothetical protein